MAYYNSAQGQPQGQYPAPIVYYAVPKIANHFVPYYKRQASTGLGATQIFLACISIAGQGMSFVYSAQFFFVSFGVWAGAWVSQLKPCTNHYIVRR